MVQIVTDSASDFEPGELEKLGICCIPLSVEFGNAVYQENVNLSKKMFYLHKGGRLPETTYLLGSMMNIKPVLHVSKDGHAEIPAKVRGIRKGIHFLTEKLTAGSRDAAYPFYLVYTGEPNHAQLLAEALQAQGFPITPQCFVQVGAVVGAHIGPDAFGIVYVSKCT